MTTRLFIRILSINCLFIIFINLLFISQDVKNFISQTNYALLAGLVVYGVQFLINYHLLNSQTDWLLTPFQKNKIITGVIAMVAVQMLTSVLVYRFATHTNTLDRQEQVVAFLPIFFLNSLPGAFSEEWLFRYIPFRFGTSQTHRYRPILLCFGLLIVFTLMHIPAYLFQYGIDLSELSHVFMTGLLFLAVYLLTNNLMFTVFFHAFTNQPLFFYQSPFNWTYFYISVLIISTIWALVNWKNLQKHTIL